MNRQSMNFGSPPADKIVQSLADAVNVVIAEMPWLYPPFAATDERYGRWFARTIRRTTRRHRRQARRARINRRGWA